MRLIDADALVDAMYDNEFTTLCPLDEVSGVIDRAPTIDAAPVRRGEWVHGRRNGAYGIWCNRCGTGWEESLNYEVIAAAHNFCPNCGADMRGVSHGTD